MSYSLLVEEFFEPLACFSWVLNLEVLEHAGKCCNGDIGVGPAVCVS
jgi:hypothetical protein